MSDLSDFFATKKAAFAWYKEEGGALEYAAFAGKVAAVQGRQVSRLSVSELLRKERRKAPAVIDLSSRRELAETEKAEYDAKIAKIKAAEAERNIDQKWMHIDRAEELIGVWVDFAFSACVNRINRALPAIIHACGGDPSRLPEAREVVDAAHDEAGNDLADAGEITAFFEVEE